MSAAGADRLQEVYPARGTPAGAGLPLLDVAAALLFALATISFGSPTATVELDLSWTQVLADAFATGRQWGTDIVFTFGPLGFLYPSTGYDARVYGLFLAGQFVLAAVLVPYMLAAASRLRPAWRVGFWLLALVGAWRVPGDLVYFAMFLFAVVPILPRDDGASSWLDRVVLAMSPPVLALLALVKFSAAPLLVGWYLVVLAALLSKQRLRAAGYVAVAVPVAYVALWLLGGQALSSLPRYFVTSLEVVAGYGAAMGIAPRPVVMLAGLASLAAVVLAALALAWRARRDFPRLLSIGYVLGVALIAWKAGFTRADGHVVLFFGPAAFALALLAGRRGVLDGWAGVAGLGAYAMVTAFALVTCVPALVRGDPQRHRAAIAFDVFPRAKHVLGRLFAPGAARAEREAWRADLARRHAMPRALAHGGSADLMMHEQGVLLVNGLPYRPRPVFQGYSAYTPRLAELNRRHFDSAGAPELVLLKLQAIDGRLPAQEDPLALLEVLRRYRPAFAEQGFVVLERDDTIAATAAKVAPVAIDAALGEWIDVPAHLDTATVALDIDLTATGAAYAALLREPLLSIDLRDDQGRTQSHRLLRPTAGSGFLLNPLFADAEGLVRWWYLGESRRVRALRVRTEAPWQASFVRPGMAVRFAPAAIERPREAPDPSFLQMLHPGFARAPDVRQGAIERVDVEGTTALQVHPPAQLAIDVDAGPGELALDYGVRAAAWDGSAGCPPMTGVGVHVLLRDASGERTLLERTLRPATVAADRGTQRLRARIAVEGEGELVLTTSGGPDGDTSCDWIYVARLVVDRAEPVTAD